VFKNDETMYNGANIAILIWRNKHLSKQNHQDGSRAERDDVDVEQSEYEEMELLERLESLREDMEDLGVTTLAEVMQRIEELHRRLDDRN
jgi:uncharacterized membrane protein